MQRKKITIFCGTLIGMLILLAYLLPYTALSGIKTWYGSFLLWSVIGLLIIILNIIVTKDWGK